ncbi:MAG: DUF4062 domain-containing protein [Candidatus Helarchaeota archaeon]
MVKRTRTFRIFVSSTFTDMKKERNALQQKVFPKLRNLCMKNGTRFYAVDLRWGVSEQACLNQQTLKICLNEIHRCQNISPRPNFIVLLGNRYGWRPPPPEIPKDEFEMIIEYIQGSLNKNEENITILNQWYKLDENAIPPVYVLQPRKNKFILWENWKPVEERIISIIRTAVKQLPLKKDNLTKYFASVTELEVLEGILKLIDNKDHIFCFFRNISKFPEKPIIKDYFDLDKKNQRDIEAATRLNQLKETLKSTLPNNIYEYEVTWKDKGISTEHLDKFCEDVYNSLSKIIINEISMLEKLDELDLEVEHHKIFGDERSKNFVGFKNIISKIQNYISKENAFPLVIYGVAGSGKSALIGHIANKIEEFSPSSEVILRFIGASPSSVYGQGLLRSICRQISRIYGHNEDRIPVDYSKLVQTFPNLLSLASKQKPLIILIDALDQLSKSDESYNLNWLPRELPPNVRIIVSTLTGKSFSILKNDFPSENLIQLEPMSIEDGKKLLEYWLEEKGRTLTKPQFDYILEKFKQNGLPLYLKIAFENAIDWKSYTQDIKLSSNIQGMIRNLLNKLSDDAEHGPIMVSHSLGYLASAKSGLTEDELLDILFNDKIVFQDFLNRSVQEFPGGRLPVIVWSRLYYDIEPYLTERIADNSIVLTFYHNNLQEVVIEEYLKENKRWRFHYNLARYFNDQPFQIQETFNHRKISELPYHLTFLRSEVFQDKQEEESIVQGAGKCIAIIGDKFELNLEQHINEIELISKWLQSLNKEKNLIELSDAIIEPLEKQCRLPVLQNFLKITLDTAKTLKDYKKLVIYEYGISKALFHEGKYANSIERAENALNITRKFNMDAEEAELLWHIGSMWRFQGNKELALKYLKDAEMKANALTDYSIQAKCYYTRGLIEHGLGNYKRALELYNKVYDIGKNPKIRVEIGGRFLDMLRVRGDYGYYLKDYSLARESWEFLKKAAKEIQSPHWIIRAEARLTLITPNIDLFKMKQAWSASLQEELLSGELTSSITGHGELAEVCIRQGNNMEAIDLCNKAEKIAKQFDTLHAKAGLAYVMGLRLLAEGNKKAAEEKFKISVDLFKKWMSPYQYWVSGTIERLG